MPQLLVTTVYEGAPVGDLVPGRPIPHLAVDVGALGHDVVTATTGDDGSCAVEIGAGGQWTVAVDEQIDGGHLRGLMTVQVGGPFALLALPVRFLPT